MLQDDTLPALDMHTQMQTYSVHVSLRRLRGAQGQALPRVFAPRFPKVCHHISMTGLRVLRRPPDKHTTKAWELLLG